MAPASPTSSLLEKLKNLPESLQDAESLLHDIAPRACAREVTLHEVVEALGPSLTHNNPPERVVGTQFLAGLMDTFPPTHLNSSEAAFITAFLVDRLQDHHSVQPAVFMACLALVKQDGLEEAEVQSLVKGLFREIQVQTHVMSDRRNIFTFLKYCITNRLSALKALGSELVLGVVNAVDGERDPRNLMVAFSLVSAVAKSGLPLHPFTEDLFEVVAAYFPIDFTPPPSDPYGICGEDLVLGLRGALASTPLFAPYCLPLLLEKLDSDLTSAKLDALHTLVACCEVYSGEDLHPHTRPLWVSLRREVVEGTSSEVEEAALSALTAVVGVLETSQASTAALTASRTLVQEALTECVDHLATPGQKLMWSSTRLLVALAVAASSPAATIASQVVPLLAGQCVGQASSVLAHQNTIKAMARVLEVTVKHSCLTGETGPLSQLAGQAWAAFSWGLSNAVGPQVQATTLAALPAALPALPTSFLQQAAQELTALLLDPASLSLREGIRTCLVWLARHHAPAILCHTLPQLLRDLETESMVIGEREAGQVLDTLATLTTSRPVLAPVLAKVWSQTETLLDQGRVDLCHHYLITVAKMVEGSLGDPECQIFLLGEWRGTQRILALSPRLAQYPHTPSLQCLASILRTIVSFESESEHLVQCVVGLATGSTIEGVAGSEGEMSTFLNQNSELKHLLARATDTGNTSGSYMLYVLEGMLSGVRRLPEEASCVLQLLRKVRMLSKATGDPGLREVVVLLHAAVINKLEQGPHLTQAEEEARVDLEADLDPSQPKERRQAAIHTLTWTCKALVVRGSDLQQWWTRKLLTLLEDVDLGVAAARSFETVVKEHPYALRPHTHARTRLLYRQRFFEGVVDPLVETFTASQGSLRSCCLVALCSLMPHLPQAVLAPHVVKVLPVVLQGVAGEAGEVVVVESVVETLASLLHHSPAAAAQHIATLVPALLALTTKQPLMVRMKALESLDALATLPTPCLLPYRDDVVRGLKTVLDDHKRMVRRTACNARSAWVMVGAPSGS